MFNDESIIFPKHSPQITKGSKKINFTMPSDKRTGSLLRTLCASKPNGKILEIGTGTGLSLTWIAEGANASSTIISIDNNAAFQQIARNVFDEDKRITFLCMDALDWIRKNEGAEFDLIFADAWPGKFAALEETLSLVKVGGFYLIDDLLPQPNWWEGHQQSVDTLVNHLERRKDFVQTTFNWSTGLMLFTRIY